MAKAKSKQTTDGTTSYTDLGGRVVHASIHLACKGLGCDGCNQLGFEKSIERKKASKPEAWTDEQPPRVTDDGAQRIKAATERRK